MNILIELVYLVSALLFVFGLRLLSSPTRARRGNLLSSCGMLLAVGVTLLDRGIVDYRWLMGGLVLGSALGVAAARAVAMTAMPEMVALLNGFGGLASLLVAWEAAGRSTPDQFTAASIVFSVVIGGVTFTGSLIAWAKLSERLPGQPLVFPGQQIFNGLLLLACGAGAVRFCVQPESGTWAFYLFLSAAVALGVLVVLPIGGGDMPVVISLLNSYSGLAACATGFVLQNKVLVVTGSLVGASGLILTRIMCQAMNRSLLNVLFSGFGRPASVAGQASKGAVRPIRAEDAYVILEAARSVVIVPGYGLAVAQAQHAVRELGELLQRNGTDVRYAIHPVAGRMPGHMNVLLAEANVEYDQLIEMDAINSTMSTVDVCLVVGANDVVNPAAHEDPGSPIYGMPVIEAERARTVIVLKRSMAAGFAGIENRLFYKDNTRMLFGDAKASLQSLVAEFKAAAPGQVLTRTGLSH